MMFDFANTGRPMLFFTYDLDAYEEEIRGFYFDFEATAPGPAAAHHRRGGRGAARPRRACAPSTRTATRAFARDVLRARRRPRGGARRRPAVLVVTMRREQLPGISACHLRDAALQGAVRLRQQGGLHEPQVAHRRLAGRAARAVPSSALGRGDAPYDDPSARAMAEHADAASLTDEALAEIAPDRDWFIFAVVRHPARAAVLAPGSRRCCCASRLVRATTAMRSGSLGSRAAATRSSRTSSASRRALARRARGRVMRDRHFAPQRRLLAPKRMQYSRIYRTSELPRTAGGLRAAPAGARVRRGSPWCSGGERDTAAADPRRCSGPAVQDACRKLYKSDFAAFDYADVVPGGLGDEGRIVTTPAL